MEGFKREQQQQQQAKTLPAPCAKEALVALDNSLLLKYVASLPFTIPEELPAGVPATALPLHQHFRQLQLQWLASLERQSPAAPAGPQAGPVPALPQEGTIGPTDKCEHDHGAGQQQALGAQKAEPCCTAPAQRCNLAGVGAACLDDPTLLPATSPPGTTGPLSARHGARQECPTKTEGQDITRQDITQQAMRLQDSDGGCQHHSPIHLNAVRTEQTDPGTSNKKVCGRPCGNLLFNQQAIAGAGSDQRDDGGRRCVDAAAAGNEAEESTADDGSWLAAVDLAPGNAMQHSSSRGRLMPATLRDTSPAKLDALEEFAWALVAVLQKRVDYIMPMAEVKAWAMSMEPLMQYSPMHVLKKVRAELCRSGFIKYIQLKGKDGKLRGGMRLVLDPSQAVVEPQSALITAGQAVAGVSCDDQGGEQQAQQEPSLETAKQGHSAGGDEEDDDEGWLSMVDLKLRPQPGQQLPLPLPATKVATGHVLGAKALSRAGSEAQHQLGFSRGLLPTAPKVLSRPVIGRVQGEQQLQAVSKRMPREAASSGDAHRVHGKTLTAGESAEQQVTDFRGRPALGNVNSQQPGFGPSGAGGSRNKRATVDTPADGCKDLQRLSKRGRFAPANHAAASKSSGLTSKGSIGRQLLAEGAAGHDKDLKRAHAAQQRESQHQQTLGSSRLGMQTHLARPAAGNNKQQQRSTQPPPCKGRQQLQERSLVGRHMLVFWPKYDAWYESIVTSSNGRTHDVEYLDGDVGRIDMEKDRVVLLP